MNSAMSYLSPRRDA